jgi:hypothetical protein
MAMRGFTLAEVAVALGLLGLLLVPVGLLLTQKVMFSKQLQVDAKQTVFSTYLAGLSADAMAASFLNDVASATTTDYEGEALPVADRDASFNFQWRSVVDKPGSSAFRRKGTYQLCLKSSCTFTFPVTAPETSRDYLEMNYETMLTEFRMDVRHASTNGYLDSQMRRWQADTGASAANKIAGFTGVTSAGDSSSVSITNSTSDSLYQTWRSAAPISYQVDVDNGLYQVQLHFAETDNTINSTSNRRLANIVLENSTVVSNYSPFETTGAIGMAHIQQFLVRVTDGQLNISVARASSSHQNPRLAGLLVRRLNG